MRVCVCVCDDGGGGEGCQLLEGVLCQFYIQFSSIRILNIPC